MFQSMLRLCTELRKSDGVDPLTTAGLVWWQRQALEQENN